MNEQFNNSFREHDQAVHARAMGAFRWRLMRRRMVGAGYAVFAVVIGVMLLNPRKVAQRADYAAVSKMEEAAARENMVKKNWPEGTSRDPFAPVRSVGREINDEELLAIFPEGSCFIAEVNGKKTLVFSDPAVRARYFN